MDVVGIRSTATRTMLFLVIVMPFLSGCHWCNLEQQMLAGMLTGTMSIGLCWNYVKNFFKTCWHKEHHCSKD
jgi:hypothetical protein